MEARLGGCERLCLETGSFEAFIPARTLYAKHGFTACGPFGSYVDDPNTVFMEKRLDEQLSVVARTDRIRMLDGGCWRCCAPPSGRHSA